MDWRNIAEEFASPTIDLRAGWKETVIRTPAAIDEVLEAIFSLRAGDPHDDSPHACSATPVGRRRLALYGEAPRVTLGTITYSVERVLGPCFPDDGR